MSHNDVTPPGPPPADTIRAGHEPLEVNVKAVFVMTGLTLVFLVVALVALFAWWHWATRVTTTEKDDEIRRPGPPRMVNAPLNPDQPAELRELRAWENEQLTTTGWVSREAGVVRIPVERAMKQLVEKGLPATPPTTVPQQTPAQNGSSTSTPTPAPEATP